MKRNILSTAATVALATLLVPGIGTAQPTDPYADADDKKPDKKPSSDTTDDVKPKPPPAPVIAPDTDYRAPTAEEKAERRTGQTFAESMRPTIPLRLPTIFNAPTGRLLPAGIIYSQTGLDTGGGLSSELRVGLGDVAEFGLGITDQIRARTEDAAGKLSDPERIFPYVTATFKMGVAENRLFRGQPALSLGFRKSFEREDAGRTTRIAELHLIASKAITPKIQFHVGGVFWDASILTPSKPAPLDERFLNEKDLVHQSRLFGGLELEPLPDAKIMLELYWVPEFVYTPADKRDRIRVRPNFSWGVRYQVADWMLLESGVRIPDIAEVNLIDSQIFGQVKFVTRRLRRAIDELKAKK